MKKACLVVSPAYSRNGIFDRSNLTLNRDNCLAFFHDLQDGFQEAGVVLATQDIHTIEDSDFVIYNEMPAQLPAPMDIAKSSVLLFESELIRPDNWNLQSHKSFSKIFTWHDEFIGRRPCFKMNFTHSGQVPFLTYEQKSKFCTLVAGNKTVDHPLELYSHRRQAIRWFEKYHPDEFEFYGMGWDQFTFKGPKIIRTLNRIPFARTLLAEKWPSYRGPLQSKLLTMSEYKFSICYENARDIPGYITEKIFDSMSAGCIPIYWGAPNITDYVPESCFVDRRKFDSYEKLYSHLSTMSAETYDSMLENIKKYLVSSAHNAFKPRPNANIVIGALLAGSR